MAKKTTRKSKPLTRDFAKTVRARARRDPEFRWALREEDEILEVLWSVWFRGHVHTDIERKLAIFRTRKEAKQWITEHGWPPCKIRKLKVEIL